MRTDQHSKQTNSHLRTVFRTSGSGRTAARWRGSHPRPSHSLKALDCSSSSLKTRASPSHGGGAPRWREEKMERRLSGRLCQMGRSRLPCSIAAKTLRLPSVPAAKLTEERCSVLVSSNDYCYYYNISARVALLVPGCRAQEGFLARLLDVQLDDAVAELLLAVLFAGIHRSTDADPAGVPSPAEAARPNPNQR